MAVNHEVLGLHILIFRWLLCTGSTFARIFGN